MKKLLSLLAVMLMITSLCACGGNNSNDTKSEANAKPEIEEEIKYDFKNAPEANFKTIYEDCKNNIVSAKKQYVGKTYKFSGWVYAVNEDFLAVVPMKFPKYSSYGSWYLVRITMMEDELMKFSKGEIVNVGGNFSELDDTSSKMSDGVYIDNAISFAGKVNNFLLDLDSGYHIMEIKDPATDITYRYNVEKADTQDRYLSNIEEATINGTTFVEGDYISGTATMERKDSYVSTYNITEFISINK